MSESECTHCWHGTGAILCSNPPQIPQYCCRCGESRTIVQPGYTKPTGPFASDGEIASKMEQWGDALAARVAELEAALRCSTDLLNEVDRAFTNNNAMDWETLVVQAKSNAVILAR